MLIVQSVIVGVIYLVLGFLEEYLSFPMCSRPMVVGSVIGFFLGDLKTGVMIGASLELVFMGAVQIGASTPPDSLVGTAVGTAFAIIMHADVEVALALAVPIGILQQMVKYLVYFFRATTMHKVEEFAEAGDFGKITRFHFGHCALYAALYGLIAFVSLQFGAGAMQALVEKIPAIIITGLGAASQMLPAVGFAVLMNMLWDNRLCVFLFFGFILSVYLNLPIIAIAGIAATIGIVMIVQDISASRTPRMAAQPDAQSEEEAFFNE